MTKHSYHKEITALLVVDPTTTLFPRVARYSRIRSVAEANGCVPHMLHVLNAARRAKLRVFYALRHRYRPGDYETWKYIAPIQKAAWERKTFEYGTWGGEIRPEFEPQAGDIVASEHWCSSGFANTDLDLQLKKCGIHQLIVIGLIAHTCIEATVRFAAELGYDVTVVKDATTDYSDEEMHAALHVNLPNYASAVVTTEEIVTSISASDARTSSWWAAKGSTKTVNDINEDRRRFLGAAAMTLAAVQLGMMSSAEAQSNGSRPASLAAIRRGANTSFAALKQIDAGALNVGYAEAGPADGPAVILLHGWPYDIHSFVDVTPVLASAGYHVIVPYLRGYGTTRFLSSETPRYGQQSVLAVDAIALMDALQIQKAIIAGFDWGARTANVIAALWPERCKALVSVSGYLIGNQQAGKMPLPPKDELQWWYQYYFATERGRAGYDKYRHPFSKLIWQLASPKWDFDDATFERTAAAFDNPDHVAIVIHNYRWRLGLAEGEPQYDNLEKRLAEAPVINVPTVTLEGDANGAPHPDAKDYAKKFAGKYAHRIIGGGVGHNLPQEAPQAFADAVMEVMTTG